MKHPFKGITYATLTLALTLSSCSRSPLIPSSSSSPQFTRAPIQQVSGEISAFATGETRAIYRAFDRNGDRTLDLKEIDESPQWVSYLDVNRDNRINQQELQGYLTKETQRLIGISQNLQPDSPSIPEQKNQPIYTSPTLRENQAELFVEAPEIYPMTFETVQQAQESIQVDLFVLGGDIGMELAQHLVERHRAGVDIKVMVDPNLGFVGDTKKQVKRVMDYLQEQGIRFKTYPLHHIASPHGLIKGKAQIDHNKLIVVDRKVAIIGCMNYFDFAKPNHDIMFRVKGPLAQELSDMMMLDWGLPAKKEYESFRLFSLPASAEETTRLRLTKTDAFERSTKERLLENIRQAQKSIYIAILEISDADVTRELVAAYARGVDVRVLMDKKSTNAQYVGFLPIPAGIPNLLPAREFLEVRLPVRWYTPQQEHQELHMKLAIFDNNRIMAGSTNFTTQALTTFRETGIELEGQVIPQRLQNLFLQDWEQGQPLKKLSFGQRIVARLVEWMDQRYMGWW